MKFKIVYDNNAREGFKSGWGFSCVIENKEKYLVNYTEIKAGSVIEI